MNEADSGDILLFKSKQFGAKITRGFTQSDYDHVAMVLRFEDDEEVYIIDATVSGVNITAWEEICKFKDKLYSKIVWRKLCIDRNDEFVEKLEAFVKLVHKKKYKISISKLVKR